MMNKDQFIEMYNQPSAETVLDITGDHLRMSDAEAKMLMSLVLSQS